MACCSGATAMLPMLTDHVRRECDQLRRVAAKAVDDHPQSDGFRSSDRGRPSTLTAEEFARTLLVRACASGSSDPRMLSMPTWRTRSGCCAFDATGHAAAPPRIPRNSRRLISAPTLGLASYSLTLTRWKGWFARRSGRSPEAPVARSGNAATSNDLDQCMRLCNSIRFC